MEQIDREEGQGCFKDERKAVDSVREKRRKRKKIRRKRKIETRIKQS